MGVSTDVLHAMADGVLTLDGLVERLGTDRRGTVKAVQVLCRRGFAEVHQTFDGVTGGIGRGTYRITESGRAWAESGQPVSPGQGERPRKRTAGLRERAWWHLRAHRVTTLRELLHTHALGTEANPLVNLFKYLSALERAGILARSDKRLPARQSRGLVQWRLAVDLGPKAPVWRESERVIYDPNGDAIHPLDREESEQSSEESGQDNAQEPAP